MNRVEDVLARYALGAELEARGYTPAPGIRSADEDRAFYARAPAPTLLHGIDVSIWRGGLELCVRLSIGSIFITQAFHNWLPGCDGTQHRNPEQPTTVISTELVWLRWNSEPERADRYRYDLAKNSRAAESIMQDLDTVGHGFFDSLNSPLLIATFLLDLKNYPRRVRWGGKPLSAQPYLYSALFFLQAGKQREALGALESGMEEYRSEMAEKWQKARLGDYSKCKVRLERVISRELN